MCAHDHINKARQAKLHPTRG